MNKASLDATLETMTILIEHEPDRADKIYHSMINNYRTKFGSCLSAPDYEKAWNDRAAHILHQVKQMYKDKIVILDSCKQVD